MKKCKRCGAVKPLDQFPLQHGCRSSPCKPCCYLARKKERNEKRAKFLFDHPRCCICDRPLRIRGRFTCSRKCAYTRWNWMR